MKLLETKHLIIDGKNAIQIRYELDGKVNDTPMYYIEENQLINL